MGWLPKRQIMTGLVGYSRVSTNEQEIRLQIDALEQAGCSKEQIFVDKASGSRANRPGLDDCLNFLNFADTLLVWRLDRLGRSMPHLVGLIEGLFKKGIKFRSLYDGVVDTTFSLH